MGDRACGLFLNSELFLPRYCCRLVKTVENAAAVELRCLPIFAQSVNISQVSIKILTTVKNVEFVGKEHDQFYCMLVRPIFSHYLQKQRVAFFQLLRLLLSHG